MVLCLAECDVDVPEDLVASKRNSHRLEASDNRVGSVRILECHQFGV